MKNIRRIYVVLGLGAGITLSGILGLVSSLGMVSSMSELDRVEKESTGNTQTDVKDTDETNNEYKIDKYDEESVVKEEIEDKVEVTDQDKVEEQKEATDETNSTTIVIPKNYGATEISKFLEENGIIEDWYEFLVFTRESGQATKLKDGTITMPSGATNEEILDILTKRN